MRQPKTSNPSRKIWKKIAWVIVFFAIGYGFSFFSLSNIDFWQKLKKRLLDEDLPMSNVILQEIDMNDISSQSSIGKRQLHRIEKSQDDYSKKEREQLDLILEKIEK